MAVLVQFLDVEALGYQPSSLVCVIPSQYDVVQSQYCEWQPEFVMARGRDPFKAPAKLVGHVARDSTLERRKTVNVLRGKFIQPSFRIGERIGSWILDPKNRDWICGEEAVSALRVGPQSAIEPNAVRQMGEPLECTVGSAFEG